MASGRWVFGYGSLMWDPGFAHVERRPALLHGWHRAFSLLSSESWGSPERPGLVLALHPGGACRGIAYRIEEALWPETDRYLARREGAYRHVDVAVRLAGDGAVATARTFVSDPQHARYAGSLEVAEAARLIAQGVGSKGSSHGYLKGTIESLRAIGARPGRNLLELAAAIEALPTDQGPP